ncbi:Quinidine resistance protein 1 [Leucoagaricus sp. SymC.cos]|nr:Quinidine resistance protein 1 [Leucoagaricus sp. SymC.cos]
MSSEETPLLPIQPDLVYQRFSPQQRQILVSLVAWCGLLAPFISGTFLPSMPQIAADLNTTGEIVSYSVGLSVLAASIGALTAAAYSTYYGRRPVYLFSLPVSITGSFGVGLSTSVPSLMFWRFWQAAGASPGISVGAGVIGDIYKVEERGSALGIFYAVTLLGPALAPFVGGFTTHYASWRVLQLGLGVFGVIGFVFMLFAFPETSHPGTLGVDQQPESSGRNSWLPVFINPLSPLALLRSPNLLTVTVVGLVSLLTDYGALTSPRRSVLLVPLAYTIGLRYGIRNEALIGVCFLPSGIGNIELLVGAPVAGRISDRITREWKLKRGFWYPEDRLRASLIPALVFVPGSVLCSGLLTQFVPGPIGLTLNLLCLFINGFGVDMVLGPAAAYVVDILQSQSAQAMASNNAFRSAFISVAVAGILPSINTWGVAITNLVAALLAWTGFV